MNVSCIFWYSLRWLQWSILGISYTEYKRARVYVIQRMLEIICHPVLDQFMPWYWLYFIVVLSYSKLYCDIRYFHINEWHRLFYGPKCFRKKIKTKHEAIVIVKIYIYSPSFCIVSVHSFGTSGNASNARTRQVRTYRKKVLALNISLYCVVKISGRSTPWNSDEMTSVHL